MIEEFEKMRPYNNDEINPAINRVVNNPMFQYIADYLYEDENKDEKIGKLKKVASVDDFQKEFSDYAVKKIVEKTADELTYGGLENLDNNRSYLFVSNHRDIVMDSAIMQIILLGNGHKTSEITFGSNLMTDQFIVDIGKMNKMFTFYRGGNKSQQYKNALLHSAYINHTIKEKKESVWISQRDGRTKDGDDKTQTSLMKMFCMKQPDTFKALKELNIVPISISYEYEPCDIFKLKELYSRTINKTYTKSADEDMQSVLYGITSPKGHIHMQFGNPLNEFLDNLSSKTKNKDKIINLTVKEVDRQIYTKYRLNKPNFISFDILYGKKRFLKSVYSKEDSEKFYEYMYQKLKLIEGEEHKLREIFLNIYARPLINYLNEGNENLI